MADSTTDVLVRVEGLSKAYPVKGAPTGLFRRSSAVLRAVDDVSFEIMRGECLGLVGESGCGKTTLGRMLVRLESPTAGTVSYDGRVVVEPGAKARFPERRRIQPIFQDPYASLNPQQTIKRMLTEALKVHDVCPQSEREVRVAELLERVGLSPQMAVRRPHEFSGGQRQRIGIARALAVEPDFIVADEVTSALDVSVQAQILALLARFQAELGLTYLLISHNLAVVRHISQRVAVMYLGRIVETAPTRELFAEPKHPYTQALIAAVPSLDSSRRHNAPALEGDPPDAIVPPTGCPFHTRCPQAMDICRVSRPELQSVARGRTVACHLYQGGSDGR
jgi:oligopeptide/dipeptide ABC transporter ATP-binding protein